VNIPESLPDPLTHAEWLGEVEAVVAARRPWTVISAWCGAAGGMHCAALQHLDSARSCVIAVSGAASLTAAGRAAEIVRQLQVG
jgi:hypothetical protein